MTKDFALIICDGDWKYIGPSGVRALPLAAGKNIGGHYFW